MVDVFFIISYSYDLNQYADWLLAGERYILIQYKVQSKISNLHPFCIVYNLNMGSLSANTNFKFVSLNKDLINCIARVS